MLKLTEHPDFDRAAPTPDHFIPVTYVASMAAAAGSLPDPDAVPPEQANI